MSAWRGTAGYPASPVLQATRLRSGQLFAVLVFAKAGLDDLSLSF
jgi:hypothetical protein